MMLTFRFNAVKWLECVTCVEQKEVKSTGRRGLED